ncbi:MAG: MarR family transcriptional regulator [Cohaesibacter sp.]|jgi:DNA-binding MarR family transcriptional regulator|nr:MarR family transcriptional regulator [Cohaesibacter sp.]
MYQTVIERSLHGYKADTKSDLLVMHDDEKQGEAIMSENDGTPPCDELTDMDLPQQAPAYLSSLGQKLNRATRLINQVAEKNLARHDLTLPQWVVLTALWRTDGLKITHLADYCGNGQPALSRILDRMEAKGWVERCASDRDRRAVRVFLTPKGREQAHLIGYLERFNEAMMKGISQEQKALFFSLLDQIGANGERLLSEEIELAPK